ncbi:MULTISPECIES: caspase family protein [Falsihalocynthiibacter]|uniref:caspase family protein n=1 Tax=Falsihalocynthiibacter TaxID=2854182 RepID=UPI0030024E5B
MSAQTSLAEPRVALIMGNGAYSSVTQLDNPVSDAHLMETALIESGFDVRVVTDASQIDMNRAIAQFGRDLRSGGEETTGLFYYAGHAVQSFGSNFLLPVDTQLTDAADLSLVGVPADAVLRQMFSASNRTNIVILDACRNNPFESIPALNDNGLAEMNAPRGTFLAYSTAPGAVALDGLDGNSPFTKTLATEITREGVSLEQTFKSVRIEVVALTNGQQTPWDTSSLTSDFAFRASQPLTQEQVQEKQLWDSVRHSDDPVPIMLFLRAYPAGIFTVEARDLLNEIMRAELAGGESDTTTAQVAAPTVEPEVAENTGSIADEEALIGAAQSSGKSEDYEAYLEAYPNGIYAELAGFEQDILAQKAAAAAAPVAVPESSVAAVESSQQDVTFTTPLTSQDPEVVGRSIAQLIEGSPAFPPFEGLPEEAWNGKTCSNCHEWTAEALCTQGKTYLLASNERSLSKSHPLGGAFKQGLRHWAGGGCLP